MVVRSVLFSELICDLKKEELDWLQSQIEIIREPAESTSEQSDDDESSWYGPRFLQRYKHIWPPMDDLPFQIEFCETEPSGPYAWIHSVAGGDVTAVCVLVQEFLKKFRPHDIWTMTFANVCEPPTPGAIGGGGMVVSADKVYAVTDYDLIAWLERQQCQLQYPRLVNIATQSSQELLTDADSEKEKEGNDHA